MPQQVAAGIGNLRVIAFTGLNGEQHWVHMEIFEGSYGGRYGRDGMDAVDTLYANTRNNPIEDIESHLPLRVERYELRENAVAPGQWRGGMGSVREFVFLADGGASVEGDGHKYRPWGFARRPRRRRRRSSTGRAPGRRAAASASKVPVSRRSGRAIASSRSALRRRLWRPARARAGAGAATTCSTAISTTDGAKRDYGVVIGEGGALDVAATAASRSARAGKGNP